MAVFSAFLNCFMPSSQVSDDAAANCKSKKSKSSSSTGAPIVVHHFPIDRRPELRSILSMEGVSTSMYKGLRGYWRRRGYEKLRGSGRPHKNRMELRSARKRRVWRIKMAPKLSFLRRIPSPKKFLVWLRDAYVKLMLGFANSQVFTTTYGGAVCHNAPGSFGKVPLKEYDEKMIVEIYKSLMLPQGQLVAEEV